MIHIGDDSRGQRVEIPIHHTGVFGQTGVGKTRLLKYMLAQAIKQGYRVLIFDSKVTGAEFEGIGQDTNFYIEESTDPDVFRSLLEGMRTRGKGNMERYRGGFIEICRDAKTFDDIGKRLEAKLTDPKIRGFTRGMYQEIEYDYGRLMKLLQDEHFPGSMNTAYWGKIVRVPTHRLPNLALQGLVVRSMVEALLRSGMRKVIVLVDEAPNFVNQKRYNPAKDALQTLDAQGRSVEIFGWYSGQTITGFDKSNMKNLWYWVMGREMEKNEAKDVFDTMTDKVVSLNEIKRLKVRQFILSTPEGSTVVMVPEVSANLWPEDGRVHPFGDERAIPGPMITTLDKLQSGGPGDISPNLGVRGGEGPKKSPDNTMASRRPPDTPKPVTTQLAAFTIEVTKLECDSLEGKIAFLIHDIGADCRNSEILEQGIKYGWVLAQSSVSTALSTMIAKGLVIRTPGNRFNFPEKVQVKVVSS